MDPVGFALPPLSWDVRVPPRCEWEKVPKIYILSNGDFHPMGSETCKNHQQKNKNPRWFGKYLLTFTGWFLWFISRLKKTLQESYGYYWVNNHQRKKLKYKFLGQVFWLVVEPTHLKKYESNWIISPGFGVKVKNVWVAKHLVLVGQ